MWGHPSRAIGLPVTATTIQNLAQRLQGSDTSNAHEQREIFERIRELRSDFEGPLDPESQRCLEAAGMLVAYLARMGVMAGEEVRAIAVRLLHSGAEAEALAAGSPLPSSVTSSGPAPSTQEFAAPVAAEASAPKEEAHPEPPGISPAQMATLAENTRGRRSAGPPQRKVLRISGNSSSLDIQGGSGRFGTQPAAGGATERINDMMLGQILLQHGQVLEEHLQQATRMQRLNSMRLGECLIKIGAVTRQQVDDALSYQASCRRARQKLGAEAEEAEPVSEGSAAEETQQAPPSGMQAVGEVLLGEILVEQGVTTRAQLDWALSVQRSTGQRIGEALVQLGVASWEQIEQALRVQAQRRRSNSRSAAS